MRRSVLVGVEGVIIIISLGRSGQKRVTQNLRERILRKENICELKSNCFVGTPRYRSCQRLPLTASDSGQKLLQGLTVR